MRRLWMILIVINIMALAISRQASSEEFIVYSIYKEVDLGIPNDPPQKDFYINMGAQNGLRDGSKLQVLRKLATYDLTSQKLYKDVTFPIAKLKVIHVEANAAIARLEQVLPGTQAPAISPRAVMIGDLVKNTE